MLDATIKSHGKLYWGVATDQKYLTLTSYQDIISSDFGQVTPENSMKWAAIEPTQGNFNFEKADFLVNWAQTHGKLVRGHTLIWHRDLPLWVSRITDREILATVVRDWVTMLVSRYRGKIYAWDVCNEIVNTDGTLRSSVFSDVLGEDFVGIAFNAARPADPDAKLYINDFTTGPMKVAAVVNNVQRWRAAGIPIDGIGAQCHLSRDQIAALPGLLQTLSSAVTEIAITELDIANGTPADYAAVVKACLSVPNCVGITSWGLRDPDSWIAAELPLLFDAEFCRKPAYATALDILRKSG